MRRHVLRMLAVGLALSTGFTAWAKEPIRIGAVYPMSGPASFLGIPEDRALRMRVEQLNAAGGVNGRKLEVQVYDTEGNGTKMVQQLRRLIESDRVDVVFGPSTSGESLLAIAVADEAKVPLIAHGGTEKIVRPAKRYVFNSLPTDRVAIAHVLGFFRRHGIKTVGLMSAADGYGQSGRNILEELAPTYGVRIVAKEEFSRQDPDMTAQVLRVRQSGADAMLVWGVYPAPTVIARNAKAIGYGKPIFLGYGAASNDIITGAGAAAEGIYISSFRLLAPDSVPADDPVKPVVMKLYNDYKAKYGEAPANFAQHSYDAILILEAAIKHAKEPITRDSLRDAIEQVDVVGANGHFRFTPEDHGGLDLEANPLLMLKVVNGGWQVAE
ncbi:MAG: ABC transporter substrate-binding protein [Alphaproteobacteria bacterium]